MAEVKKAIVEAFSFRQGLRNYICGRGGHTVAAMQDARQEIKPEHFQELKEKGQKCGVDGNFNS